MGERLGGARKSPTNLYNIYLDYHCYTMGIKPYFAISHSISPVCNLKLHNVNI